MKIDLDPDGAELYEVPTLDDMRIPLDTDELRDLAAIAQEAALAALGCEEVTIHAEDMKAGDVIRSFGATVYEAPSYTDSGMTHVHAYFRTGGAVTLPCNLEIKVVRRIQ